MDWVEYMIYSLRFEHHLDARYEFSIHIEIEKRKLQFKRIYSTCNIKSGLIEPRPGWSNWFDWFFFSLISIFQYNMMVGVLFERVVASREVYE